LIVSGLGFALSVLAFALSVLGFGGSGTSLAGGTTTCADSIGAATKKNAPTITPRRERRTTAAVERFSLAFPERTR
jgi:hypothetical protein